MLPAMRTERMGWKQSLPEALTDQPERDTDDEQHKLYARMEQDEHDTRIVEHGFSLRTRGSLFYQ